jgi:hypothetical protein
MTTKLFAAFATLVILTATAAAGYDCQTRKSGSVTITTCGSGSSYSQCRSYRSGSVIKTSCR